MILMGAVLAAWGMACGPGDRLRFVELRTEDERRSDTFFAPFRATFSAPAARMRETRLDVGSARYDVADRQRVYLFDGDLQEGFRGGRFLLLPQLAPDATGPRTLAIAALDPAKPWQSMRVYDVGACSALVPWRGVDGRSGITPPFAAAVDAAVLGNPAIVGAQRFGPVQFQPILQTRGDGRLSVDERDALELRARYDAREISGICFNGVRIELAVRIRLERRPGTIRRAPHTPAPAFLSAHSPSCRVSRPGSTLITDAGDEYDFEPIVELVSFEIRGPCIAGARELAESIVRERIAEAIPEIVRQQLFTQLGARVFGLLGRADQRRCTCDAECNSESVQGVWTTAGGIPIPGRRHVCNITNPDPSRPDGTCRPILEPDRILLRPEGIEVVLSEGPNDFQDAFFDFAPGVQTLRELLCGQLREPFVRFDERATVEVATWPILEP
ncbi:MAG: hypothetical protein OHK0013_38410 [Sandaracinaceae bacterium]